MKLSKRLQCISDKVPICNCTADIGTDHALVPIYLIKNKICKYAIASDIKEGPLEIAKANIYKNNLDQYIKTRISDGLKGYTPNEVNTVIIAGMGGELIREILKGSANVCNTVDAFILQPMTAHEELREWLYHNGFIIDDEVLAKEDNKLYTIMVCRKGKAEVNKNYYDIGIKLIENNDPLLFEYIDKKTKEMEKIIEGTKDINSQTARDKMKECQEKIDIYKNIRNNL